MALGRSETDVPSIVRMLRHVHSGQFSTGHYEQMWESRLGIGGADAVRGGGAPAARAPTALAPRASTPSEPDLIVVYNASEETATAQPARRLCLRRCETVANVHRARQLASSQSSTSAVGQDGLQLALEAHANQKSPAAVDTNHGGVEDRTGQDGQIDGGRASRLDSVDATSLDEHHTRGRIPRNIPKGAKRTMSANTPCALRFYTLVLRLTAVTLTHASGEARHSHEEGREESALAQVLFNSRVSCHRCEGLWRH